MRLPNTSTLSQEVVLSADAQRKKKTRSEHDKKKQLFIVVARIPNQESQGQTLSIQFVWECRIDAWLSMGLKYTAHLTFCHVFLSGHIFSVRSCHLCQVMSFLSGHVIFRQVTHNVSCHDTSRTVTTLSFRAMFLVLLVIQSDVVTLLPSCLPTFRFLSRRTFRSFRHLHSPFFFMVLTESDVDRVGLILSSRTGVAQSSERGLH